MTTQQVSPETAVPDEVVDRLLWRDAQYVLARHQRVNDGCSCCGESWPCTARRLAERAEAASRLPWQDGWRARDDLNAVQALPEWRAVASPALPTRRPRPYAR